MTLDFDAAIRQSIEAKKSLSKEDITAASKIIIESLKKGGKVLLCGNGGSAADAQHMAGELVGKFKMERKALAAVSLSTDTSILTALANDYGQEIIFSRQVEALGKKEDVLVAFSTSGTSPNIIAAVLQAKKSGMHVIGFTGSKGEKLKKLSDVCVMVASDDTPRIQEAHQLAYHLVCALVEEELFKK